MTAKEYLRQARDLDALINAHLKEKADLQQMAYSISSPSLGERVQTSRDADAPYVRTLEKIMRLEDRITGEIDRLVDLKAEMLTAIEDMANPQERLLLKYRYFEGYTWEEIGMAMNVCDRTARRIHGSALQNFVVPT
ncbi:MAG: flagellar biosynthesis protein FliA [Lachnospiraceae bacterium]|nr:flagellar biosynthesis protein FliA [Lachnospiraceae bacterium]